MRMMYNPSNKGSCEKLEEMLGMLEPGDYLVTVTSLAGKTVRDMQNRYFLMIDIVSSHSGEDKYSLHEDFKTEQEVASTKVLDLEGWANFIEAFKWKAFNDYDLII